MKRGQHKSAKERKERREEILNWIQKVGPFSVPVKKIAEKYEVDPRTIRKDREILIKKMDFSKVENTGKQILTTLRNNLSMAEELRVSSSGKDKLGAITVLNQTAQTFTDLLEKYGFKERLADKLEHSTGNEGVVINLVTKSDEEIKKEKNANKE